MPKKKAEQTFQESFKELEELAAWFEEEQPDLDKGLKKFERAMELASLCKGQLEDAEGKIQEIKSRFEKESFKE